MPMADSPEGFSFYSERFLNDPAPDYAWMLSNHPVFLDKATGMYVVSRYDDVRGILCDTVSWSSRNDQVFNRTSEIANEIRQMYEKDGWVAIDTLSTNDPPQHKHYRALVDRAFTHDRVAAIRPLIDELARSLASRLADDASVEFIEAFAAPLVAKIMAHLLGLNPDDSPTFRRWTHLLDEVINPCLPPERERQITRGLIEMQHHLMDALKRKMADPDATLLSALANAEVAGERLTEEEILNIAIQLFGAGSATTVAAIGSAIKHLADYPEVCAKLRAEPDAIPAFIEEILRLEAPVQRLFRRATRDTRVGNVLIPRNAVVIVQIGSANVDHARFECPNLLDLGRPAAGRHLTFGTGAHFCIGNQLARAELASAVNTMVTGFRHIRLCTHANPYEYSPVFIFRSLKRLEISLRR